MRLIDADAVYNKAMENHQKGEIEDWEADSIIDYLDDAPTINDAEIVVRCKNCIFRIEGRCFSRRSLVEPDNFCSWGEYQTNTAENQLTPSGKKVALFDLSEVQESMEGNINE